MSVERRTTPKQRARAAFSGLLLLLAAMYYYWSTQLRTGTLASPGPGVWPTMVALAMIVICAISVVESLLRHEEGKQTRIELPQGVDARRALAFAGLLVAYIVSLRFLGFLWPSLAVVVLSMRALAQVAWWRSLLTGVLTVGIVYYAFVTFFETRFPDGSLMQMFGG